MAWRITSQREARKIFNAEIRPYVVERYGASDSCALNEAWGEWIDNLRKERRISDAAYDKWTRS